MERNALRPPEPEEKLACFSSGSTLLDLALGGYGWAEGRVVNVVGDRSVGKTLLAIEAFANFARKHPGKPMRYCEAEAAFGDDYAQKMGFPKDVSRPEHLMDTVEEFNRDVVDFVKIPGPSLDVLDSLDALSDEGEMLRPVGRATTTDEDGEEKRGKGSYGVEKAKQLSQFFRRNVRDLEQNGTTLFIISQVRDNIGVTFGKKYKRSGGKALDFYASQVVYLAHLETIERTVRGQKRAVGVQISAKVEKLKTGNPFRKVEFPIVFGYGIDDELSMIDWLTSIKEIDQATATQWSKDLDNFRRAGNRAGLITLCSELQQITRAVWNEIENKLAPPMSKYGG